MNSKKKAIIKDIILFLLSIICIVSCNKTNDMTHGYKISVDNIDNMIVTDYSSYLNPKDTMDLDVNHDSVNDFRLINSSSGSILCLNSNSMIMGKYTTDTTFFYTDTTETWLISGDTIYDVIIKITNHIGSCRFSPNDSIVNILPNQFKIIPNVYNDYIGLNDVFISDSAAMYIPWMVKNIVKDTSSYHKTVTILGKEYDATIKYSEEYGSDYCHSFPVDQIFYIGIKLKVSGAEKIGWIKLAVGDSYILLLGSAVQN